jgi:hypothetical protein
MHVLVDGYASDDRCEKDKDRREERDGDTGYVATYDTIALCRIDRLFDIAVVMHLMFYFAGYVVNHGAGLMLDGFCGIADRHPAPPLPLGMLRPVYFDA